MLTAVLPAKYSSTVMLRRALSLAVLIALMGGAIGASADDGSLAERNMPLCCKKARLAASVPQVSMARLCCKLNCSEPGSGGLTNASSLSRNQKTTLATAIVPTPIHIARFRNAPTQFNHSYESNPKYI